MTSSRRPVLPPVRASALFARTVFKELLRAQYSKADVVGFVNDLLELVATHDDEEPLSGVTDPETHLANAEALGETLEFEMRRGRGTGGALLVLEVELEIPEWVADDVVLRLRNDVARAGRRALRPHDTLARVKASSYVVVAPSATLGAAAGIAARLAEPLMAGDGAGVVVSYRAAELDGDAARGASGESRPVESASALLAFVGALEPSKVAREPVTARASARPRTLPPPKPRSDDVVLALGGGAARAAAHIGVLRALRESGARVTAVAGTSAGALVGAMSLMGMTEDEILARFLAFPKTAIYTRMRRMYAVYRRATGSPRRLPYFQQSGLGIVSNAALAAVDDEVFAGFVAHFVGEDRDISTLPLPFSATATDLTEGRVTLLSSGPLHAALRATCAVPGLFAPQTIEGRLLVDGSIIDEVPVKGALRLAAHGRVVAVHLDRPDRRVTRFVSSAEVVTRSSALVHAELVREQLRHAPEVVSVPIGAVGWLDFRRAAEAASLGHAATLTLLSRGA